MVADYKQAVVFEKQVRADVRIAKAVIKQQRTAARAANRVARIIKLEAKLAALKNPVGIKAVKANKKPSKVTILKAA
jgi:hypothetical protein